MDLYEYQARNLFRQHGVPVLDGAVATTPEEARSAAQSLLDAGSELVVVKAQVKTGGRGKAGGVKLARTAEEAEARARDILGMDIKGHTVRAVLISDGVDLDAEYYFSILLDRAERQYLAMCSREGGMDIETLAAERPEALARIGVDPLQGVTEAVDITRYTINPFPSTPLRITATSVQVGRGTVDPQGTTLNITPAAGFHGQMTVVYRVMDATGDADRVVEGTVRLIVRDRPDAPTDVKPAGVDDDALVVHQQDIQAVVNALWKGGAEAVSIQGQRIISTSGIKCVGNSVVLHGIPYAPPYVIEAIGDAGRMAAALKESRALTIYRQYADAYGLGYRESVESSVSLPAFQGALGITHAKSR